MKKLLGLVLLLTVFMYSTNTFSQCECEFDETPVCIISANGEISSFPSECLAICFGLAIVDGDCDEVIVIVDEEEFDWDEIFGDWEEEWDFDGFSWADCDWDEFEWEGEWYEDESNGEWQDGYDEWLGECDCEESDVDETVCVAGEFGFVFELPSECHANCLGFEIVDCDWEEENPIDPNCDCDDQEFEPVCVEDPFTGDQFEFFSACWAECEGLVVVECDWEQEEEEEEEEWGCDCDDEDFFDFVCVIDPSTGDIFEFPSACWAECEGLEVVECNWGEEEEEEEEWECDCDDEEIFELVCVIDPATGDQFEFFSACWAECEGLEVVECNWEEEEEGEEEEEEWGCDCDDEDFFDFVCVIDPSTGDIFEFPNACLAMCEGLEIVECDWEQEEEEEENEEWDCECDDFFEMVCVMDPATGDIFEFPSACWAECEGLEVVECNWEEENEEVEEEWEYECDCPGEDIDFVCVMDPDNGEIFEFPNPCLAECFGLIILDCELEGDMIEDENWADYGNEASPIDNFDPVIKVYPNPTLEKLTVEWNQIMGEVLFVKIMTVSGQEILSEKYIKDENPRNVIVDVNSIEPGMYFVHVNGLSIPFIKE